MSKMRVKNVMRTNRREEDAKENEERRTHERVCYVSVIYKGMESEK